MTEITLNKVQRQHYKMIVEIWKNFLFAIDLSVMGSGKSYVSSKLFSDLFEFGIVICPASIISTVWEPIKNKFNLNLDIISYETLSGVKGCCLKHNYLKRSDDEFLKFEITEHFKTCLEKKCLIIIDEFHRIKNDNTRHNAVKILTNFLVKEGGDNRLLFLSGSPFDNMEQIPNFLQIVNIIKDCNLFIFNKSENMLKLTGFNEFIEFCKKIDIKTTESIISNSVINNKTVHNVCFNLYVSIIQKNISSAMPTPIIDSKIKCYNGYFTMTDEKKQKLTLAINQLHSVNNRSKIKDDKNRSITRALRNIQTAKVEIFERLTNIILEKNDKNKVCLYFDYDEPIFLVEKLLNKWNPIVITGKKNSKDRQNFINIFQKPTDEIRLLIFNMAVGCEGINLHDTSGEYPRYVFAAPSYFILRMHQMTRRFYRVGTKSDTEICFVYGNCDFNEVSLINSLSKKTLIMKNTLLQQVKEGIKFPADYDKFVEKKLSYNELLLEKEDNNCIEETPIKNVNCTINIKNLVLESNIKNLDFSFE